MADENRTPEEARISSLERAIKRERSAREQAETLLETKSRELYLVNKDLSGQHQRLERRNIQLEETRENLARLNATLSESYATTVEVFARLVQSRAGLGTRISVAVDAVEIGKQLEFPEDQLESLYRAALLCDVGKLSLPDESVHTPYVELSALAQREYQRHPIISEATLLSIEPLSEAALIIRKHCERYDGTGFPDKIKGEEIPLPSRILSVTKAYADLMDGHLLPGQLTSTDALAFIKSEKGKRYDEAIVDLFITWLRSPRRKKDSVRERVNSVSSLKPGCRLTRDLCDNNGVLILAKGKSINRSMIEKLTRLEKSLEEEMVIYTS